MHEVIFYLLMSHSLNVGWQNMTVSSARRTRKPERAEKRMRNSPQERGDTSGCPSAGSLLPQVKAFTQLKMSTGVKGTREANATDRMSRTFSNDLKEKRLDVNGHAEVDLTFRSEIED